MHHFSRNNILLKRKSCFWLNGIFHYVLFAKPMEPFFVWEESGQKNGRLLHWWVCWKSFMGKVWLLHKGWVVNYCQHFQVCLTVPVKQRCRRCWLIDWWTPVCSQLEMAWGNRLSMHRGWRQRGSRNTPAAYFAGLPLYISETGCLCSIRSCPHSVLKPLNR